MKVAAGIDVSKGHLEVSVSAGKVKRFVNDEEGVKALAWWLARAGVNIVVCESTGGYERSVVEGLEDSGILVWVAHPLRVRALAQAYGQEAKTDALDAQMLSRYGEMFEPEDVHRLSESEQSLREVIRRREQLVSQRVQEKNRLEKGLRGMARESTERHIEWLDEEIERLEAARGALLRHDAELLERAKLYSSVSGVGEHTAGVLLTHLPELGKCSGKSLAALVGLAPWSKDSGRKRGHRVIRGGRGAVRRALYMSALSAVRRAGQMRSFYERLRSKGKPFKVALVAVMRKMLLQLNSVARRGTPGSKTMRQPPKTLDYKHRYSRAGGNLVLRSWKRLDACDTYSNFRSLTYGAKVAIEVRNICSTSAWSGTHSGHSSLTPLWYFTVSVPPFMSIYSSEPPSDPTITCILSSIA